MFKDLDSYIAIIFWLTMKVGGVYAILQSIWIVAHDTQFNMAMVGMFLIGYAMLSFKITFSRVPVPEVKK